MSILDGVQRVLSLYAEGAVELSFTDVATRLSLPKSTTSRLLNQMQRHGLLDQDASSRRYRPGLMLSMAARAGMAGRPLDSACRQVLARLSERSGLTAYLSTLNQRETVVLQRLDGSHPVQVLSPPGSRRAASGTAMGGALLSRLSDAEFTDLYGANPVLHLPMEGRDCPGSVGELAERVAGRAPSAAPWRSTRPCLASAPWRPPCAIRFPANCGGLCLSFVSFQADAARVAQLREAVLELVGALGRELNDPFWQG